ncbi:MAG: glutathione S-transferase family protein [Pseudomonadota bacterium]
MLKLYHVSNTRSGRIVWLLEELGLPYELNKLEFSQADLKSNTHRARHPLGRIPVLEDGEVTIFESGAIVEYVLARHAPGKLKPAVDSPRYPAFLQWFHYCEGMVMPPINIIVVQTKLLPPERRSEDALNQAQKLLTKSLGPVNGALAGREYLAGEFSAADIMLGHAMYMSRRLGCVADELSELHAYIERIAARPAFDKAINT